MHFDPAAAAVAVAAASTPAGEGDPPRHLVVMVNGLFGSSSNWRAVSKAIERRVAGNRAVMLHPSKANSRFVTFEGVDSCGDRLAEEIREVVSAHPSLRAISVIGHSLGGVLARRALATLWHAHDRTIAGLEPRDFVTLATPHVGVAPDTLSALPLLSWFENHALRQTLKTAAPVVGAVTVRRTGRHLFLTDRDGAGGVPLIFDMATNEAYLAPLAAFANRKLYCNVQGDHLVAWHGAALALADEAPPAESDLNHSGGIVRHRLGEAGGAASSDDRHDAMVERLRAVGAWERINVTYPREVAVDTELAPAVRLPVPDAIPVLAHNHIQVTRPSINHRGLHVVRHLADSLDLDGL